MTIFVYLGLSEDEKYAIPDPIREDSPGSGREDTPRSAIEETQSTAKYTIWILIDIK